MADAPSVYIFHGEDEFSLSRALAALKDKVGDPSLADLNTTILDGRTVSLEEVGHASKAMPFLTERRLVVVHHAAALGENDKARQHLFRLLSEIPQTTALVLVEDHLLTDYRMEKRGEMHWLEEWGRGKGDAVLIKRYLTPAGNQLIDWILKRANDLGGGISTPAAVLLARLAGEDLRTLDHEIDKLLSYVNLDRRVEPDDVEKLVVRDRQDTIFDLVDAIGNRDRRTAMAHFHALLTQQDVMSVMGMIVRQFRLLLLGKEVLQEGGNIQDITRKLEIKYFVAKKIDGQARKFSVNELESIYRRLLDIDTAMKMGEMEADLNIDLLIDAVTRVYSH